jgi:hypothetical protein
MPADEFLSVTRERMNVRELVGKVSTGARDIKPWSHTLQAVGFARR